MIQPAQKPWEARWYQDAIVDASMKFHGRGRGNGIFTSPTGSGKSAVYPMLAKRRHCDWRARSLILTHRNELVSQDADAFKKVWPEASVGVYAAGLGRREIKDTMIASIDTVYKRAKDLGSFDFIEVDEVHRVNPKEGTKYQRFFADSFDMNPNVRFGGGTATDFRQDQGMITGGENRIFDSVIYRVPFRRLLDEGYLCPLVVDAGSVTIDASGMKIQDGTGDFLQAAIEKASNTEEVNRAVISDMLMDIANGRHSLMAFASSRKHAAELHRMATAAGIRAAVVTGETPRAQRKMIYEALESMRLQLLISIDVLTTGFDCPVIDALYVVRPVGSPGLWCQMLGRGCRTHYLKINCLVRCYGDNVRRCGTIDMPKVIKKKPSKVNGLLVKYCEACDGENKMSAKVCIECEAEFIIATNEDGDALVDENDPRGMLAKAGALQVMSDGGRLRWRYDIVNRAFQKKMPKVAKEGEQQSPPVLLVIYYGTPAGMVGERLKPVHKEIVCVQHQRNSLAWQHYERWWRAHCTDGSPPPGTVFDVISAELRGKLRPIKQLVVEQVDGRKYDEVIERIWKPETKIDQGKLFDFEGLTASIGFGER